MQKIKMCALELEKESKGSRKRGRGGRGLKKEEGDQEK